MNRPHDRSRRRREGYLRQHGRITDKYQLHAWWLRGIADQVSGAFRPPLHPDLCDEYANGACPAGAGESGMVTWSLTTCMR